MTVNSFPSEILDLILQKEATFSDEIDRLAKEANTEELNGYLTGLRDLKSDFLLPLKNGSSFSEEKKSTVFSDRYWYFERT